MGKEGKRESNLVPRLFLRGGKTLVGASHVTLQKLLALGVVGKVSNYIFPQQ